MNEHQSVYVHIPFCVERCAYCAFTSYKDLWESYSKDYIEGIKKDISKRTPTSPLKSIYFGGGTPSIAQPHELKRIVSWLEMYCDFDKNIEITMEANPNTLTLEKLRGYRAAGFNRLSVGVQSFDSTVLEAMGRLHSSDGAKEAVMNARMAGFNNINIDLIYGIPHQSLESFKDSLKQAIELSPEHISLYALSVEKGTDFARRINAGILPEPDPDTAASCYEEAVITLGQAGYEQYEISNWCKPGFESIHNLNYWQQGIWYGYGCAAHSFDGQRRTEISKSLFDFAASGKDDKPISFYVENLSPETLLAEGIILALRLNKGAKFNYFKERYGVDIRHKYAKEISEMKSAGLLIEDEEGIRLTDRGRLLSNEVFIRFLP